MKPQWILFGLAGLLSLSAVFFKHDAPAPSSSPVGQALQDDAEASAFSGLPAAVVQPAAPPRLADLPDQLSESDPDEPVTPGLAPPLDPAPLPAAAPARFPRDPDALRRFLAERRSAGSPAATEPLPRDVPLPPLDVALPSAAVAPELPVYQTGADLHQAIRQVRDTREFMTQQFGALERDHYAMQRELSARKQQVMSLEQQLGQLAQQLEERDRRVRELDALRARLQESLDANEARATELERDVGRLERAQRNLPRELEAAKAEKTRLEAELRSAKGMKRELDEHQRQVDSMVGELDRKNREIERLSRELADNHGELENVAAQLGELNRARSQLQTELFERQDALAETKAGAEELLQTMETRERQIDGLQGTLASRDVELKQAEAVIQLLQQPKAAAPAPRTSARPAAAAVRPSAAVPAAPQRPSTSRFEAYLKSRRAARSGRTTD